MSNQDNPKNVMRINSIASLLIFSGENVIDFLNNLLISQLIDLEENAYHYSALCNPKGRIISTMWINVSPVENNQVVYMICPANMVETLFQFFNMRKFRLKISIEHKKQHIWLNTKQCSVHTDQENTDQEYSSDQFFWTFFQHNLPWIDSNNSEKFIPQHVNLDQHEHIMTFSKGCYPGQEIIARMKFLGTVKKRMTVIKSNNRDQFDEFSIKNMVSPIITHTQDNSLMAQVVVNSK